MEISLLGRIKPKPVHDYKQFDPSELQNYADNDEKLQPKLRGPSFQDKDVFVDSSERRIESGILPLKREPVIGQGHSKLLNEIETR